MAQLKPCLSDEAPRSARCPMQSFLSPEEVKGAGHVPQQGKLHAASHPAHGVPVQHHRLWNTGTPSPAAR